MRRAKIIAYIRKQDSSNAPLIPPSWEITEEADGWFSVYPLGRENKDIFLHFRHMMSHPTLPRAVYVCFAPQHVVDRLAQRISDDGLSWTRTWGDLAELRADNTAVATSIKQAWRDRAEDMSLACSGRMAGYGQDDGE
jgi:hypothetical protein